MWRARKRRSWQMLLPHMGDVPAATSGVRNSSVRASASATLTLLPRTRASSPDELCCLWFQSSIRARTSSGWWIANTGPSATMARSLSVTTVAISMMVSESGFKPVISRSIQIRWSPLGMRGSTVLACGWLQNEFSVADGPTRPTAASTGA